MAAELISTEIIRRSGITCHAEERCFLQAVLRSSFSLRQLLLSRISDLTSAFAPQHARTTPLVSSRKHRLYSVSLKGAPLSLGAPVKEQQKRQLQNESRRANWSWREVVAVLVTRPAEGL